ncbi:hypothetical protein LPJGGPFB_05255 [Ensifer adhaerens]|uniref:Uncharacterized protein (DUF2147 family) n=1 Tax=Ensifer adhaerens TaxID=106592 RepID=A0ACC5T5G9_ENSAD|nr:DUF2147 domain-containing protein [Ensifer adhaerens]MBP1876350.1 uncharacterized protein (DUF2147 family) [Ensifer adhaerens]NRP21996.1 hypothetical protein [Ensifer adhaerens]
MRITIRKMAMASAMMVLTSGAAHADPIEGDFRTPKTGATAKVAACGARLCMTYTSGAFKGKQFATFTPTGNGQYSGKLIDLTNGGKEYTGKAEIAGSDIKVSGCVMGGLICKDEIFERL